MFDLLGIDNDGRREEKVWVEWFLYILVMWVEFGKFCFKFHAKYQLHCIL